MRKLLINFRHKWICYELRIGPNLAILSSVTPKFKRRLWSDWRPIDQLDTLFKDHQVRFSDFSYDASVI